MPNITPQHITCSYLYMQGKNLQEIAEELKIPVRLVNQYIQEYAQYILPDEREYDFPQYNEPAFIPVDEEESGYDSTVPAKLEPRDDELFTYRSTDKKRQEIRKAIESVYKNMPVNVLNLSDLHIPFIARDVVMDIVERHRDSDILLLNGDMLDLFAVSKYAKDKAIALRREMEEGRAFLEEVSRKFKHVVVVEGNHERRLRNYIQNNIPADMQFLFPKDVLHILKEGLSQDEESLPNVYVVGSWWVQLWDTIFAHPDNYSSVYARTAIQTSDYFHSVRNIPHRACIIGHTHQAVRGVIKGRLIMETGCLCYDMDYKYGARFTQSDWTRAYAVLQYDENGLLLFNESQLIVV